MDNLDLAFFMLVPLALLSIGLFFYYLLRHKREEKEGFAIEYLLKQENKKSAEKKAEEEIEQELAFSDTSQFWTIENAKEQERHRVFTIFRPRPTPVRSIKPSKPVKTFPVKSFQPVKPVETKKNFNFQAKGYKIQQLSKLADTSNILTSSNNAQSTQKKDSKDDLNANLSKIKSIHKDTPLSRLHKISKKGKSEYIDSLMKKEKKEPQKNEKADPIKSLANLPDKRKKIINQLKNLHS